MAVVLFVTLGSCATDSGTNDATAVNSEQNKVTDLKLREAWEDKTKGLNKRDNIGSAALLSMRSSSW